MKNSQTNASYPNSLSNSPKDAVKKKLRWMQNLQGIEDQFIEEWHQKLHTNTTPEDISICEAYIGCLSSGNPDDFWRLLWENNSITREQLANMDRPITGCSLLLKVGGKESKDYEKLAEVCSPR